MSEPSSLKGFEIPELLQMVHSGEKFMYYDSGPQDEKRIIVFATLPAIELLEQSDDWFCDETFSTAPNVFYQVYTIHASVDGANLPLVDGLLPDKKEKSYRKLLCSLPETSTKRVTIDFEIAVRNAFLRWNENLQIQFCFFHLGQNVWRHVQAAGKDAITAFEKLQSTCPEDCQPIFNYFEDNYIGRYNSSGQKQKPRFAIERWNCCERIKKGYARTNNSVEGWNSNFGKLVNTKHPSMPKLIEKIWLISWEAAVIISNSNRCCFGVYDPLFSVIHFIHFLPKFLKFKNNARSDLIIAKWPSWTSFSFSLLSQQPMTAFSEF